MNYCLDFCNEECCPVGVKLNVLDLLKLQALEEVTIKDKSYNPNIIIRPDLDYCKNSLLFDKKPFAMFGDNPEKIFEKDYQGLEGRVISDLNEENHCFFYNKKICSLHDLRISSETETGSFFSEMNVSLSTKPLVCRAWPWYVRVMGENEKSYYQEVYVFGKCSNLGSLNSDDKIRLKNEFQLLERMILLQKSTNMDLVSLLKNGKLVKFLQKK